MDISIIREQIDSVDQKIVELFEKRMSLAIEVAKSKLESGKQVYDKEREQQKLDAVSALLKNPENEAGVRELFSQLMLISRKKQYRLLSRENSEMFSKCRFIKQLDISGKKIVYQGIEGAYSQAATLQYFGNDCECFAVPTWEDAMNSLGENRADYAVLPIENSSAGSVNENYDLISGYDHHIIGEIVLNIDHVLVGVPGTVLEDIDTVYSHYQAIAQCSEFIRSRSLDSIPLKNTAIAAQKIQSEGNRHQAAIANRLTAEIYGLDIISENISNSRTNQTRFIIVGRDEEYEQRANKISICVELIHESGSLYHVLSNFFFNNLNMTHIESRPIEGRNWEYRFFIDFSGNLRDEAVQNAILGITEESKSIKILGNYYSAI